MTSRNNKSFAAARLVESLTKAAKGDGGEGRKRRSIAKTELLSEIRALLKTLEEYESETLVLYRPLPKIESFHAFRGTWRVIDGSNQSGKTLAAAVEVARALTGTDPYNKYPLKDGSAQAIGLNIPHLGDPMFRKLMLPGAMSMIDDEITGLPRLVRPDPNNPTRLDPYDEAHREKWRDAPPLIPARFVSGISYYNKAKQYPELIFLKNGWRCLWKASTSKPAQGIQIDLGWIDEHIDSDEHYYELNRGLIRRDGQGIWSATQQVLNDNLETLRRRYEEGDERVFAVRLFIAENPFLPESAKQAYYDSLPEDQRRVRWYGEPAIASRRVYSEFSVAKHTCDPFEVPNDWTRYCVVDPGTQRCGTLIAAVPPDESSVYILESTTLYNNNAIKWAEWVAQRSSPLWQWEAFIIDQRMGRQTGAGYGMSVAAHYASALDEAGVKYNSPGRLSGFHEGCDIVQVREESLRLWLVCEQGGQEIEPKLKLFRGKCQELERQIASAVVTLNNENKRRKMPSDELDCLEYLAAFNPYYGYKPEQPKQQTDYVWEDFIRRQISRANRLVF